MTDTAPSGPTAAPTRVPDASRSDTTRAAIRARGVSKSFDNGSLRALDMVALSATCGEFVNLVGPSG